MGDLKVPAELVKEWRREAASSTAASQLGTAHARQDCFIEYIADRAAQWGADQELEACCEWLRSQHHSDTWSNRLRAARRPKPPTLAEQATTALHAIASGANDGREQCHDIKTLTAALNRLAELEAQQ